MGKPLAATITGIAIVFFLFSNVFARVASNLPETTGSDGIETHFESSAPQNGDVYLPIILNQYPKWNVFGIETIYGANESTLQKFDESGADWLRFNPINWSQIEQVEGVYDWSQLTWFEDLVLRAHQEGFVVLPVVHKTPDWARQDQWSTKDCAPIKMSKLNAFGDFMYALVERYSKPPYNVLYWQIWNEPDADPDYVLDTSPYGCWADDADEYNGGAYYADVLQVVYPRIKQANPSAKVIIGGLLMGCNPNLPPPICTYNQSKYLEGILRHNGAFDGKNYFDIVAFHAYSDYNGNYGQYVNGGWQAIWNNVGPVLIEKSRFIKDVLAQYNASDKGIMSTEIALRCGPGDAAPSCSGYNENFDYTKAFYVAEAYAASIAEGLIAGVYYTLKGGWRNVGLLNNDLSERHAYVAFQVAQQSFQFVTFNREIDSYSDVIGYAFNSGENELWFIRSLDGNPHAISLPSIPSSAWDVLGTSIIGVTTTFTTTIEPTYLLFED